MNTNPFYGYLQFYMYAIKDTHVCFSFTYLELRRSASGVLPGVTTGLGKYEGLCGKAGASVNSCISVSSSAQCSGGVVNGLSVMAAD